MMSLSIKWTSHWILQLLVNAFADPITKFSQVDEFGRIISEYKMDVEMLLQ